MAKYKKKPVVVDAVQWTGQNFDECLAFLFYGTGSCIERASIITSGDLVVTTLKSKMIVRKGRWIIKDVKGEFCIHDPDIFKQTYEKAED